VQSYAPGSETLLKGETPMDWPVKPYTPTDPAKLPTRAAWCVAVAVHNVRVDTIDMAKSIRKARREKATAEAHERALADGWHSYDDAPKTSAEWAELIKRQSAGVPLTTKEWLDRKFVRKEQDDE
jgi:hypothetical protein